MLFYWRFAFAAKKPFLGRWEPKKNSGPVLIYSPESGWNARSQRLWGLCWGLGVDPQETLNKIPFIKGRVDLAEQKSFEYLKATVADLKPCLLILDPLITCYLDRDENSAGEVQGVLNSIRELTAVSPGMSIIVAHHLNKANNERSPFHKLRGSSALGAWSDGLISLRKESASPDAARRVEVIHRDARSPEPIGFNLVVGQGDIEGCPSFTLLPCEPPNFELHGTKGSMQLELHELQKKIATEIKAHPGELTNTTLALKLKRDKSTIGRHINRLIDIDLLCKDASGKLFSATQGGEK